MTYNVVLWKTPPKQVQLLFTDKAGPKSGLYPIPGLVWVFGSDLSIYAYDKWEGQDTVLYHAPFLNVSRAGVCLGSAGDYLEGKNRYTFTDVMEQVEHAFFFSKFSHAGAGSEDSLKVPFESLYERTLGKEKFPYEVLVPVNFTVKKLCNEIFNT